MKFFPGIFISEAEAFQTAVSGTGTALAIENIGVKLPPSWTPTITPTVTNTLTPSRTPTTTNTPTPVITRTLGPTRTPIMSDPTILAEIQVLQQQIFELRQLTTEVNVNTHIISKSRVRPIVESYYLQQGGSEENIRNTSRVLVVLGLIDPDYDLLTYQLKQKAEQEWLKMKQV